VTRLRPPTKAALGAVLSLVVLGYGAVRSVDVDAAAMGRSVLREASASTGIRLQGSQFHFNLFRGLRIEGVEAGASFPSMRYDLAIPEVLFEHRLTPLLRRQVAIARVVAKNPLVTLVYGLPIESEAPGPRRERPSRPPAAEAPGPELSPNVSPTFSITLSELVIRGGTISVRDAGRQGDGVTVIGLDLTLTDPQVATGALTLLHAITASGVLDLRELHVGDTEARDASATLSMAGGRIDLEGEVLLELGVATGSVHLDFNTLPFRHRFSIQGRFAGVPGVVSLDMAGMGLDPKNLRGDGRLAIPEGRFDDTPLWEALGLVGEDHDADEVSITIRDGQILLDGSWLRGSVDFDGALELQVRGQSVSGTWDEPVGHLSPDGSSRIEAPQSAPREGRRETAPPSLSIEAPTNW